MRLHWLLAPGLVTFVASVSSGWESAAAFDLTATVRQLGSERYAVRREADEALRKQSALIVPLLEKQLPLANNLEQRRRLERVIAMLLHLPWHQDLASAQVEARASGKPILVFSTFGNVDGFG